MAFNWWKYLDNTTRTYKKKRATLPIIRFMNVKLKMTYHDNLFAFLCWQFLKIGFKQFYVEVIFFSFHYPFNFLTRMSNATNSNKYAWQFHFVFCYVFYILRVTITTVTITFSCHIGILCQLHGVSKMILSIQYLFNTKKGQMSMTYFSSRH